MVFFCNYDCLKYTSLFCLFREQKRDVNLMEDDLIGTHQRGQGEQRHLLGAPKMAPTTRKSQTMLRLSKIKRAEG